MMTDQLYIPSRCDESFNAVQRVLIVDDEQNLLSTLTYALVSYGMNVTVCENATEALLRCMFDEFHYIITDYDMPGMDGVELTMRLRERFTRTIIIGMSGSDRSMEFLGAGANDFLQKPFVPYRLAMMIDGGDLQL